MSLNGNKVKNDAVIAEMLESGWFRVSPDGRIETCYQWRAVKEYTDRPWFVCDRADGKGYRYVSFRHARVKAHRLAFALYHNVDLEGLEINHLDGDRLNNRKENLELCDAVRQSKHAFDTGLNLAKGVNHPKAKLTEDQIREIRLKHERGARYVDLAPQYGVTKECIRYICIRHTWKHVT